MKNNIIVTGGAGFIGSNFILDILGASNSNTPDLIINLDCLTYAGNLENLESLKDNSRYAFVKGSITDKNLVAKLFNEYQPRTLIHFAAESHVDRSIRDSGNFIETNIIGTYTLLESARQYFNTLNEEDKVTYYGDFGYGRCITKLFTYICEHKPQRGHCVIMDMSTGKLIPMCHPEDFRLALEEEC